MRVHETKFGSDYMAGLKSRMFYPTPDELRRDYGDNAILVASSYGKVRRDAFALTALMMIVEIVILVSTNSPGPAMTGREWALLGLNIFIGSYLIMFVIYLRAKQIRRLKVSDNGLGSSNPAKAEPSDG